MSHNLSFNSITNKWEMFSRGAAWHYLGQIVQDALTWADAQAKAGMTTNISKQQLEFRGLPIDAYGLFRDDYLERGMIDKAFVAPTTLTYEVMQYDYMFAYLDTLLQSEGAHYESAGVLNNGAQAWVLVNLHQAFEIGASGDRYETYLCFMEDRTGKKAARVFLTFVRVVCANTLESAVFTSENGKSDAVITFRHTANLTEKMEQAIEIWQSVPMNIEILKTKLTRLNERVITRDSLESILNRLFPADTPKQAEAPARVQKMLDVIKLFENNDHNMFPEIRGTALNLHNAFDEWVDHFSNIRRTAARVGQTDDQIRAERAMFGDGAASKQAALEIILEETADAPLKTKSRRRVAVPKSEAVATKAINNDTDNSGLLDDILDATVLR
jgi:phage/plasmid-like protein (TIGR03299 family)